MTTPEGDTLDTESFEAVFERGYGWRARIGHLNPSLVDESIAKQFYQMAPNGVTLVQTSLRVAEVTEVGIRSALERAEEAAVELAKELPDCIIVGGSPTAVLGGYGSDIQLSERLEKLTGIPTTFAQTAAVEAMRLLNMRRLAVVTPNRFRDVWNAPLIKFLEASGFEVAAIRSHPADDRGHLGFVEQLPPKTMYQLAIATYGDAPNVDGIYMPAAPSPVVDTIELLEKNLQTKVVTSCQATLWKGMRMAGLETKIEGYGSLLRM